MVKNCDRGQHFQARVKFRAKFEVLSFILQKQFVSVVACF